MNLAIAIAGQESASELSQLHALAQQLNLPTCDLSKLTDSRAQPPFRFTLSFIADKSQNKDSDSSPNEFTKDSPRILALSSMQDEFNGTVHIDFVHGKLAHRREFGGGRGQPLAKAIGLRRGANPTVVDATAGLGRDAFVLAHLGAQVTMVERSPILAALLNDGLQRLMSSAEHTDSDNIQLQLIQANAIEWLQQQANTVNRPEVVYMDPMYPHRTKSALVKKEMRALRALVGDDEDSALLLQAARQCALKRVVVKRPKGAPLVGDDKPSGHVESKNTRYDIYPSSNLG